MLTKKDLLEVAKQMLKAKDDVEQLKLDLK